MDMVRGETLLQHLNDTLNINISVFHIECAFTYFLLHVEDENLSFVSFLCEGDAEIWYVINRASHKTFEDFVASQVLAGEYLNDHYEVVRQILGAKTFYCTTIFY